MQTAEKQGQKNTAAVLSTENTPSRQSAKPLENWATSQQLTVAAICTPGPGRKIRRISVMDKYVKENLESRILAALDYVDYPHTTTRITARVTVIRLWRALYGETPKGLW